MSPDNPLERLNKLSKVYRHRQASEPSTTWDADQESTSIATPSWRTFATATAPSELLSFYRDVHMYTVGRAINRLGALIADPIDNAMARRELKNVLRYLKSLGPEGDWQNAGYILGSKDVLSRLMEAGRYHLTLHLFLYSSVCIDQCIPRTSELWLTLSYLLL
jgi:hypothetical protein